MARNTPTLHQRIQAEFDELKLMFLKGIAQKNEQDRVAKKFALITDYLLQVMWQRKRFNRLISEVKGPLSAAALATLKDEQRAFFNQYVTDLDRMFYKDILDNAHGSESRKLPQAIYNVREALKELNVLAATVIDEKIESIYSMLLDSELAIQESHKAGLMAHNAIATARKFHQTKESRHTPDERASADAASSSVLQARIHAEPQDSIFFESIESATSSTANELASDYLDLPENPDQTDGIKTVKLTDNSEQQYQRNKDNYDLTIDAAVSIDMRVAYVKAVLDDIRSDYPTSLIVDLSDILREMFDIEEHPKQLREIKDYALRELFFQEVRGVEFDLENFDGDIDPDDIPVKKELFEDLDEKVLRDLSAILDETIELDLDSLSSDDEINDMTEADSMDEEFDIFLAASSDDENDKLADELTDNNEKKNDDDDEEEDDDDEEEDSDDSNEFDEENKDEEELTDEEHLKHSDAGDVLVLTAERDDDLLSEFSNDSDEEFSSKKSDENTTDVNSGSPIGEENIDEDHRKSSIAQLLGEVLKRSWNAIKKANPIPFTESSLSSTVGERPVDEKSSSLKGGSWGYLHKTLSAERLHLVSPQAAVVTNATEGQTSPITPKKPPPVALELTDLHSSPSTPSLRK